VAEPLQCRRDRESGRLADHRRGANLPGHFALPHCKVGEGLRCSRRRQCILMIGPVTSGGPPSSESWQIKLCARGRVLRLKTIGSWTATVLVAIQLLSGGAGAIRGPGKKRSRPSGNSLLRPRFYVVRRKHETETKRSFLSAADRSDSLDSQKEERSAEAISVRWVPTDRDCFASLAMTHSKPIEICSRARSDRVEPPLLRHRRACPGDPMLLLGLDARDKPAHDDSVIQLERKPL